jgi:glutathione S-transferase
LVCFPKKWEGVQDLLWRYFENDVEGIGFKLNDIYWREFVPRKDHLGLFATKSGSSVAAALDQWREQQSALLRELKQKLTCCEEMLLTRNYLLDEVPRFVDFDLFGMLGNFLYSGHYALPGPHKRLAAWYERMAKLTVKQVRT